MKTDFSDVKERVIRESEFYDGQESHRHQFETKLAYLNQGIGWHRRNEIICRAMRIAVGARVLEIGSQSWEWCLFRYEYQPQQLTCINISESELEIGRAQAAKLGMECEFRKMDAHNLEFADDSIDVVFGVAILHHLDFPRAMSEIHRVLRKGGQILFVEPLRHNPIARLIRWLTPRARTADEVPLGRPELRLLAKNFDLDNYYSELFTVVGSFVSQAVFTAPVNPITKFFDRADDLLARMLPPAVAYYRSVVICGTKVTSGWRS